MTDKFIKFINNENLADKSGSLLLGVSGGVDSMVMMELFLETGFNISVAHCNFGLRGSESNDDELFVAKQAETNRIPFHSKYFDTFNYSDERGISIQMAARELRYSWFDTLMVENGYSAVAIAHNKNDIAETFMVNILRGTGIRGLTGIKAKTGNIIRPLLFAERKEIVEYAIKNNVSHREDSSNSDIKYKRNRIRHRIIPEFENISGGFINSLYQTTCRLNDVETIYSDAINNKFNELWIRNRKEFRVEIKALLKLDPLPSYLYEFLRIWGFPRELIARIIKSLEATPGKQFYSATHRLVKDRSHLIVTPKTAEGITRYYIEEGAGELSEPVSLRISKIKNSSVFRIPADPKVACLDLSNIHFPLMLRKWQKGDYFQPLGMNGMKKLSDFFIDNKFSIVEKENTWLLMSGNRLAWIIGRRIDDRFKITDRTKEILMIELLD